MVETLSPRWRFYVRFLGASVAIAALSQACARPPEARPRLPSPPSWHDRGLSFDRRARLLAESLTLEEKLTLVTGYFGVQTDWNEFQFPEARPQSAGLVRGVPRLGCARAPPDRRLSPVSRAATPFDSTATHRADLVTRQIL